MPFNFFWGRTQLLHLREIHEVCAVVAVRVVGAPDQSVHDESEAFVRLVGEAVVADVMETDARVCRHFHAALDADIGEEDVLDAEGGGEMVLHVVGHLVGGVSVTRAVLAHVGGLPGRIVRCLALKEVGAPVLAVP